MNPEPAIISARPGCLSAAGQDSSRLSRGHTIAALVRWLLLLALVLRGHSAPVLLAQNAEGDGPALTPAEFKTVFLAKISNYINWPESRDPIVIGLLGGDPFNGMLQALTRNASSQGRPIEVRVIPEIGGASACNVLFVASEHAAAWASHSQTNVLKGVLTVGEAPNFSQRMTTICNLSVETRKLEVSLPNAKQAGIQINSKLLKIARVHR